MAPYGLGHARHTYLGKIASLALLATGAGYLERGRALRDLDLHCKSSLLSLPQLQPTHHLGALLRLLLVERLILLVHRLPDHRNDK